jgi:hypothetical protein
MNPSGKALESFIAMTDNNTAIGKSDQIGSQLPIQVGQTKPVANLSPVRCKTKNPMKKLNEIKMGQPKPPFLIIAPIGAPINKKRIQANEKIIFRCSSFSCAATSSSNLGKLR